MQIRVILDVTNEDNKIRQVINEINDEAASISLYECDRTKCEKFVRWRDVLADTRDEVMILRALIAHMSRK